MVRVAVAPSADGWRCRVFLEESGSHTEHSVNVRRSDLERWGRGSERQDVVDLVVRTFEFLLEREPAPSILKTFDLSVVRRYFPEYDRLFTRKV